MKLKGIDETCNSNVGQIESKNKFLELLSLRDEGVTTATMSRLLKAFFSSFLDPILLSVAYSLLFHHGDVITRFRCQLKFFVGSNKK